MRVYGVVRSSWVVVAVTTATYTPLSTSSNGDDASVGVKRDARFVVLGIDGKVVVDADPGLYLPKKSSAVFIEHLEELRALPSHAESPHVPRVALNERRGTEANKMQLQQQRVELQPDKSLNQVVMVSVEAQDDDEFSDPIASRTGVDPLEYTSALFLKSDGPAVQGSIIFAELSCVFVAFIGYLVHSIRLWSTFSRGQRCCLAVVFGSAVLYQAAVSAWYVGTLSSDVILALSSLITRMISLGMVPITTTSFMGRARELCHDQNADTPSSTSTSSTNRSSRRHRNHQRARYS